ncbi:hypothetical protein IEC33019_4103 [Pseudomonas putida]|uniref:Uncharacterized protein n=1 Tax=Pseudomonas putida TaxID=303 RepID=A0A1B2FBS1_PSEPU|nr:hypothetical protein IEC33019_4103 [Pseudomonas putida]
MDQVSDSSDFDAMPLGECFKITSARHAPIIVHHFHNYGGRRQSGQARKVTPRLGMASPCKHTSLTGS